MKIRLLLLFGLCSLFSVDILANNQKPFYLITTQKSDVIGGIFQKEIKKPLQQVTITAHPDSKKESITLTDTNGFIAFRDLKPGVYQLFFEKKDYYKHTKDKVSITPDNGYLMNVEMNAESNFILMPGGLGF